MLLKQPEHHAAARAALAERHLGLVRMVAMKFIRQRGLPINHRELIGYGTEGLLQAIDGFDPARGIKLTTYASGRVHGAILDGLRNLDWVPRLARRRHGDDCRRMVSMQAILARGEGRDQLRIHTLVDPAADQQQRDRESREAVRRRCVGFSAAERLIVEMYYVEGLNMREIGKALGLSESRVSQMHSSVLDQMRARVAREHDDDE